LSVTAAMSTHRKNSRVVLRLLHLGKRTIPEDSKPIRAWVWFYSQPSQQTRTDQYEASTYTDEVSGVVSFSLLPWYDVQCPSSSFLRHSKQLYYYYWNL